MEKSIKDEKLCINNDLIESFSNVLSNEELYPLQEAKRELSLGSQFEISRYDISNKRIHYISDLHLMHNIRQKNLSLVSDIKKYFRSIIKNMLLDTMDVILIAGDVASDFNVFELFVETLSVVIRRKYYSVDRPQVIFVLGNHELWGFHGTQLSDIVKTYRNLLSKYGMYLLHNNMIYMDNRFCYKEISSETLDSYSKEELRELLRKTNTIFFGGLAFSGYNNEFNANNGIYRDVIDRETEIKETKTFECLYKKVSEYLFDKNLVVVTHTPVECWLKKPEYHKNFIYVNGHTHKNFFHDDGEIRIYADNQVGYKNYTPKLKSFNLDGTYDIFADVKDGVYELSKKGYEDFYRGKNIRMDINWKINSIYMLKKNGYYCFIHENALGSLSILNGGRRKNILSMGLNIQDSLQYYYNNMDLVIKKLKNPLDQYSDIQKKIADEVKKIGGSGNIHGCIIDIDFVNHLYVNPLDMKITAYYAVDMISKTVYPSVQKLLEHKRPALYRNYNKLLNSADPSKELPMLYNEEEKNDSIQEYLDTDIYKASREIMKMQRLDSNVLVLWVDPQTGVPLIEKKNIKDMNFQELSDELISKVYSITKDEDTIKSVWEYIKSDEQIRKMLKYIEMFEKMGDVLTADELLRLAVAVNENK